MTYVPHYRVTMSGLLGGTSGSEIFSMGFALAKFEDGLFGLTAADILDPNLTVWTDIKNDCVAYFARPDTMIHADAVLTRVKIADIGADGLYRSAPVEFAVSQGGGFSNSGRHPNQVAYAVTLKTNGDLGRVKGRFYVPLPSVAVDAQGIVSNAVAEQHESSAATFINAINNQPGIDVLDLRMAVASQGRKNKNGTVRVPPANHAVTSVAVGQVLDTVRRRRNKLPESRDYTAVS